MRAAVLLAEDDAHNGDDAGAVEEAGQANPLASAHEGVDAAYLEKAEAKRVEPDGYLPPGRPCPKWWEAVGPGPPAPPTVRDEEEGARAPVGAPCHPAGICEITFSIIGGI